MTKLSNMQLLVVLSAVLSLGQVACAADADPIPTGEEEQVSTGEQDVTRSERSTPSKPVVQHSTSDDIDDRKTGPSPTVDYPSVRPEAE